MSGASLQAVVSPSSRSWVETGTAVQSVRLAQGRDSLPTIGWVIGHDRITQSLRWELPSTTGEAPADWRNIPPKLLEEVIEVAWHENETERSSSTRVVGLPRPPRDLGLSADEIDAVGDPIDQYPELLRQAMDAEEMIRRHVYVVHEAQGLSPPCDAFYFPEAAAGSIRDMDQLLDVWLKAGDTREPRYALIVRLAEKLRALLPDVCNRPRVILKRTRELQAVARVQQLDATCLRWLARQPGLSVIEKAGVRQEVLAVTRVEQADTLENRVVKDLLRRAVRAGVAYLREHREFRSHDRVKLVREFLRLLRRLLRESPVGTVSDLVGIPQPNYVLQHDPRYSKLWADYLRLVRDERELDDAWQWRNRVWSETVILAIVSVLRTSEKGASHLRCDVLLHGEQVSGRYMYPEPEIGPVTQSRDEIHVVLGCHQSKSHPDVPKALLAMCPDLVVIRRVAGHQPIVVAIWVWPVLPERSSSVFTGMLSNFAQAMRGLGVAPMVVLPDFPSVPCQMPTGTTVCDVSLTRPQKSLPSLRSCLDRLLLVT